MAGTGGNLRKLAIGFALLLGSTGSAMALSQKDRSKACYFRERIFDCNQNGARSDAKEKSDRKCAKMMKEFAKGKETGSGFEQTEEGRKIVAFVGNVCSKADFAERTKVYCGGTQKLDCSGFDFGKREKEKTDCPKGAKDCFEKAQQKQKEAQQQLAQEKQDYQSTVTGMDKAVGDTLGQAINYLEAWDKYNRDNQASHAQSQSRSRRFQADAGLVEKVIRGNSSRSSGIDLREVESLNDSGIKQIVGFAMAAEHLRDFAEDSLKDIARTEGTLNEMAAKTSGRISDMNSIGSSISGGAGEAPPGNGLSKMITSPFKNGKIDGSSESTLTGVSEKKLESEKGDKLDTPMAIAGGVRGPSGAAERGADEKKSAPTQSKRMPSLRELLAKRIRDEQGGAGENGSEKTGGKKKAGDPAILETASFERQLFDAQPGVVPGEKLSSNFAMKASEDDAAILKMVADWEEGRRPASAPDQVSGLLPMDSSSLFERVHQAHHSCVRRSCL